MRRNRRCGALAYAGLERLRATDRVDAFAFLSGELKKVKDCRGRKWYIDRLAKLGNPAALEIFKKERQRRGGIFNTEYLAACMDKELKQYIEALEPAEKESARAS